MVKGQANIQIPRSPDQLFEFIVVDFERNYRRWSPEVQSLEMLTPGPLRVGSRARQVRVDQGRRSDTTFRVVALEQPTRIDFAESADKFQLHFKIESVGTQTRLSFCFTINRLELFMRPFEKLIRVAIQDGTERVVRNIKTLIESETKQPSDSGYLS